MRQLWIELNKTLIVDLPLEVYEEHFLPGIYHLAKDPVTNVRIALGLFLVGWGDEKYSPLPKSNDSESTVKASNSEQAEEDLRWKWLFRQDGIEEVVQHLAHDDRDIYNSVVKLEPLYPNIKFTCLSMRGLRSKAQEDHVHTIGEQRDSIDISHAPESTSSVEDLQHKLAISENGEFQREVKVDEVDGLFDDDEDDGHIDGFLGLDDDDEEDEEEEKRMAELKKAKEEKEKEEKGLDRKEDDQEGDEAIGDGKLEQENNNSSEDKMQESKDTKDLLDIVNTEDSKSEDKELERSQSKEKTVE